VAFLRFLTGEYVSSFELEAAAKLKGTQ